jgi:hypothetical protein
LTYFRLLVMLLLLSLSSISYRCACAMLLWEKNDLRVFLLSFP